MDELSLSGFDVLTLLVILPLLPDVGCSVGEYVEGSYVGAYEGGLEGLAAKHRIRVGLADVLGEKETDGAVDGIVSSIHPLELLLPLLTEQPLLDLLA